MTSTLYGQSNYEVAAKSAVFYKAQEANLNQTGSLTSNYPPDQDVWSLNTSSLSHPHSTFTSNQDYSHHALVNPESKESSSLQYLAHQYGLPSVLPRIPNKPISSAQTQEPDFATIRANYLTMLQSSPSTTSSTTIPNTQSHEMGMYEEKAMQHLGSLLVTSDRPPSPIEIGNHEFNQYLTSPLGETLDDDFSSPLFDDSPSLYYPEFNTSPVPETPLLDDFHRSPIDDSPYTPNLSTPLLPVVDEFPVGIEGHGWGEPLIHDSAVGMYETTSTRKETSAILDVSKLVKMSPQTPALESFQSLPTPQSTTAPALPVPPSQDVTTSVPTPATTTKIKRKQATGTRPNITPASLVPYDAPIQPRRYITPSATSRKDVPAVFTKGRKRSQPDDPEGEDELGEAPGPNATQIELIEYKRRQNTLAARKSRKRKLEYQQELERRNEELESEVHELRTKCTMYESMLKAAGVAGFEGVVPAEDS